LPGLPSLVVPRALAKPGAVRSIFSIPMPRYTLHAGLALTVLLAGCGGGRAGSSSPAPGPQLPADSIARLEASYRARMDSARRNYTSADVDFMSGMIHHHGQALVMAALIPERTATAAMRTLGGRIINAQRDEIALMQQWLRERSLPVPQPDSSGSMALMPGLSHDTHHALMPGMLTPGQLEELRRARGTDFDRLFLLFMIQHHHGAVTMVDALFNTDGAALDETVFKLASGVRVDQVTEIDRMHLMLRALR
jgi:uncharacterized protein (DUF305 family)